MSAYEPMDLRNVTTYPLAGRESKVKVEEFAKLVEPKDGIRAFYDSLPNILAARDLRDVVGGWIEAHRRGRPQVFAMGAHVIKCGLSPLVIDLMRRKLITAVVLNGAGAVHDLEIAIGGRTSEDVKKGLDAGTFGLAEETGRMYNLAAMNGARAKKGLGRALGELILDSVSPHAQMSVLAQGTTLDVPVTVHVALGGDIVHMHPSVSGAALGETSMTDFRIVCSVVAAMEGGGVWINAGSAVILPEVFLKALAVARNLGYGHENLMTVNLSMAEDYRPMENVVRRPGGRGYSLIGRHEILIPLLRLLVLAAMEKSS